MTDNKKTCCYQTPRSLFRKPAPCQFRDEMNAADLLVKVGGLWFCPYHLPYTSAALNREYGATETTSHPDLKANWPQNRIEGFDECISRRINEAINKSKCDLSGVVFPGAAVFSGRVMPEIDFSYCRFAGGNAYFDGAIFSNGSVSFIEAQFSGGAAIFDHAQFSNGPTFFVGVQFSNEETHFRNTHFSGGEAFFSNAKFSGSATFFEHAEFSGGHVYFNETEFSAGEASFKGVKFTGGDASFSKAKFSGGPANFETTQFSGGAALFTRSEFSNGPALFNGAQFSAEEADFHGADFSGGSAFFSAANFSHGGDFSAVPRSKKDTDTDVVFRNIYFVGTTFSSKSDLWFNNRSFLGTSNFHDATFGIAPTFHGCALHQDTSFPPIENFKDTKSDGAAHAYRTLRLAMKQQEAHEEEAMFWALEQRSKRNNLDLRKPKNWLPWGLSWSYDLLSNYGLNVGLPARWLGGWIVYSTVIYACVAGSLEKLASVSHWLGALGFSIAQMARPFFIWGDYDGANIKAALGGNEFSFLIKMLATVDSIVSLTLIALFILAVRRRFRMQ